MLYTFKTPIALATWIKSNIVNPLRQEQLMLEGCRAKPLYGFYEINVTSGELKYQEETGDDEVTEAQERGYSSAFYFEATDFHDACGDR